MATTQPYWEMHVTIEGNPEDVRPAVERVGWAFSAIDGDILLGGGVKCYATKQLNKRVSFKECKAALSAISVALSMGGLCVVREKIESVDYDNRYSQPRNTQR